MAGDDLAEKITELEIRKEAITATLDELKNALSSGEVTQEDYDSSEADYNSQLSDIDKELEELKAQEAAAEAEEAAEEEPEGVDYESLSWADLQRLAAEKGIQVVGKGVTKEKVIGDLKILDAGGALEEEPEELAEEEPEPEPEPVVEEAPAPAPEPSPMVEKSKERAAKALEEMEDTEEGEVKRDIDPSITARYEMLKGEVPSLNSTLKSLAMKLQVSTSSLEMIKKNQADGLVDSTTYNNLRTKYEDEIKGITERIAEIESELGVRENIVNEYANLVKVYEKHTEKTSSFEDDVLEKEMELNFMGSSKFYLVSNIKDHIAGILTDIENVEEALSQSGITYPDASYLEDRNEEIKRENENLVEMKSKVGNFETLLKSLAKELKEDELDKETHDLLRTEYSREKNKAVARMGRIEGRLRMLKTEMKAYEKLEEALVSCKDYIDMAVDSFKKIWLEDKINAMNAEINRKSEEIMALEKEVSAKLTEMEKGIEKLLAGLS
jgi:chromosome segregation ATPase